MESGSTSENSGDKATTGNGPEKDAQKRKKGKDHRNDKKEKRNVCNGDESIYFSSKKHGIVKELAEKSCLMSENPSLEGDTCNSNFQEDKKRRKKDKEVGTVGEEQVTASVDEKEHAEVDMCNSSLKKDTKKRKKDKEVGTVGEEQVTTSGEEKEHPEGGMCNSNLKKDKKKKKKEKEIGTVGKEQVTTSSDEKEHAEGGVCNSNLKEDKKKRKKDKDVGTFGEEQVTISGDENLVLEHTERDKLAGEQVTKSKKGKRKHQEVGTSDDSAGGQIVSEDKKKKRKNKHSVTLEEDKQVDISKMGEKGQGKKSIKESDNVAQDLKQYTPVGGKNGKKQKMKSKDDNEGGKRANEKVAQQKDKGRRVSFTDAVEVFSIGGGDDEEGDGTGVSDIVHGQRFSPEEDAKLMEAIMNYAEMKQLGEKGLEMIRSSIKYPEIRGCWAEIATSLPHRPAMAVYKRARILLYRSAERKWTEEEYEVVRRFVEKNGTNWKKLAVDLGKSEIHVKDTWRRMKPKNLKKGPWTQDEYQNLFDLVNLDLRVKAHQKIDHGHRLIRENISWEAISEKLTTRSNKDCCLKWYQQLASPLVKQGIWADTDDYLLVEALQKVDAVCIEDVDWENLLDHRSGELCRQRWNQMIRTLGGHREKPFIELVEVLARRYCPEMIDYRKSEASDLSPETITEDS